MSNRTLNAHGKPNPSTFIVLCLRTVFCDKVFHGRWLPAEQLHAYMHMKCNIGDDIKFTFASMMRAINKILPLTSMLPNIIEISGGIDLNVFRHSFQNRTRRHFFWVTATAGVIPPTPTNRNSTAWEQDCVLTRLLSGRSGGSVKQRLPVFEDVRDEPDPKRQKSTSEVEVEGEEPHRVEVHGVIKAVY